MTATVARPGVERIGIGLAAVGRPAYINTGSADALPVDRSVPALRAQTAAVLDAVWAAGVRWVDTARSYGRAEEFLHHWLGTAEHPGLTVSSKWGYAYVGAWQRDAAVHEAKEHSLARFTTQLERDPGAARRGRLPGALADHGQPAAGRHHAAARAG